MSDWNTGLIDEFRANGGKVGGMFEGAPLLILHTTGARTGTNRETPLMYQDREDAWAVFASKGGADDNPDWYHNIVANPDVKIEIGSDVVSARARVAAGDEHEEIWERQKTEWPQFGDYEEKTARSVIPVVVLDPS